MRKILIVLACAVGLGACEHKGAYEQVRITSVTCYRGRCVTSVQFPDGTRVGRNGNFGAVGDTFQARLVTATGAASYWQ